MGKNLKGAVKLTLIFTVILIVSAFLFYSFIPIFAESATTIWTTDSSGNFKQDFSPYSIVYIHGSGFFWQTVKLMFL